MKTHYLITVLFILALSACRKADYEPPQYWSENDNVSAITTSLTRWSTETNYTTGQHLVLVQFYDGGNGKTLELRFTKKPDHSMRYRVVLHPTADDEIGISPDYPNISPDQFVTIDLNGSDLHVTANRVYSYDDSSWAAIFLGAFSMYLSIDLTCKLQA